MSHLVIQMVEACGAVTRCGHCASPGNSFEASDIRESRGESSELLSYTTEEMAVPLQLAKQADLPSIVAIMNSAFRGTGGERGWSMESGYITGERTSESLLREEIAGGARYLVAKDEVTSALRGCVSLREVSPETWYLGSLSVGPALQNAGFGRKLLSAAEEYASAHGAPAIEMTVLHVRDALISWYERRGYRRTGETRPFPYGDDRYGVPTRSDLAFVVLEKRLADYDAAGSAAGRPSVISKTIDNC